MGYERLGKGPGMARAQQFQLRGQCRVGIGGERGGNHCGQSGPGGRCGQRVAASIPFHLILRSERGEKRPDVRSLSDLRLYYCGIEETGRFFRSISLNRTYYSPRSSEQSASVPRYERASWTSSRRASAGIASPLSSSRNKADGGFSPRPKGAPQTRPSVTALGKRDSYSLRAVPCLGAFEGALRS